MSDRLIVGTFTKYAMSHHYPGTWRLPEATGNRGYADVETWVEVARISEAAKIDFLMWADDLGSGGYFDGDHVVPLREGILNTMDPSVLVGALSRETTDLGFVVTSAMVQDHPFHFARRMSTLDHITGGRVGWNVVTSAGPGMWRNFGLPDLDHDARYRWAEEYMDVLYKLWEGSYERDAGVHSVVDNLWVDADRVHLVDHESEHYRIKGPHQVEPSPQGTPMIFQAGSSEQGTRFAGRHAEVQFIGGGTDPVLAGTYANRVREAAAAEGRDPDAIVFAPAMSFAVAESQAEAQAKWQRYVDSLSITGGIAKLNNMIGFDLSKVGSNVALDELRTEGIQGVLDVMRRGFPEGYRPTVEEVVRQKEAKSIFIGTPERIADHIEELQANGINGLLVNCIIRPGSIQDFADHVVPELQRRGVMQREYGAGTLREKVFGAGDLLPDHHPGASYRAARPVPTAGA